MCPTGGCYNAGLLLPYVCTCGSYDIPNSLVYSYIHYHHVTRGLHRHVAQGSYAVAIYVRILVDRDSYESNSLEQVLWNQKRVVYTGLESFRVYGMKTLQPLGAVEVARKASWGRGA